MNWCSIGWWRRPDLNAVIRAVVKTAIFKIGWEVIGMVDGFEGYRLSSSVPLEKAISNFKLVDPECELVKITEGMGVSFGR